MSAHAAATNIEVTDELATTPAVPLGRVECGRIIGRTYGGIQLTVYESDKPNGTYALCSDVGTAGVLASIDLDESVELPTKLAGCAWLKFVGGTDGDITLILKDK